MDIRSLNVQIRETDDQNTTSTKYLGGKVEVIGQGLYGSAVYFDVHYHFTIPYDFYNEEGELTNTEDLTISDGFLKINGQLSESGKITDNQGNDGIPFSVYDVFEISDVRYVVDGRFLVKEQDVDDNGFNAKIDIATKEDALDLTCKIESSKKNIYTIHELSQTEATFEDYVQNEQMIILGDCLWDSKVVVKGTLHYGNETTFDVSVIGGSFFYDGLRIPLTPTESNFKVSVRTDFYGNIDNVPRFRVNLEGSSNYNSISISFLFELTGYKEVNIIERNLSVDYTRGVGQVDNPSYVWEDFIENSQLYGGINFECIRKPKEKSTLKLTLLDSYFGINNQFPLKGDITYINGETQIQSDARGVIEIDEILTRKGELDGKRNIKVLMNYTTKVGNDEEDEFILTGDLTIHEDFSITNDTLTFYSKHGTQLIQTLVNVDDVDTNNGLLVRLKDIVFKGDASDDVYIDKSVLKLDGDITLRCSKKSNSVRSMEIVFGDLNTTIQNSLMTVDCGYISKTGSGEWLFNKNSSIPTIYLGGQKKFVFDVEFDEEGNLLQNYVINTSFDNSALFDGQRMLKMDLNLSVKLVGDSFEIDNDESYLLFTEDYDFFSIEYKKDIGQETYYVPSNSNFLENGEDLFYKNELLFPYNEISRHRDFKRKWIGLLSSLRNGKNMFRDSKLEEFTCIDETEDQSLAKTILANLAEGDGMFSGCLLDTNSVKTILDSLNVQENEDGQFNQRSITIGVDSSYKTETLEYLQSGELTVLQESENVFTLIKVNGGEWKITIEWNEKL